MKNYYNYIVRSFLLSLVNKMYCEYHGNNKGEIIVKCYYHDTITLIENFIYNLDWKMFTDLNNNLDDFINYISINTDKIIFFNDYLKLVVYR